MNGLHALLVSIFVCCFCSFAQPWRTYQSKQLVGGLPIEGKLASSVAIPSPAHLAFGSDGKLYFNSAINGTYLLEGEGIIQSIAAPTSVQPFAVTSSGIVYSLNGNSVSIRQVNGSTLTVSPQVPGGFVNFAGIAVDSLDQAYATDSNQRRIFRIDSRGNFSVVAGLGSPVTLPGIPFRIAVDGSNRLVLNTTNGQILRMNPSSSPEVLAAVDGAFGGIAAAQDNTIYFVNRVSRNVTRIAGGKSEVVVDNINGASVAVDRSGRLLIAVAQPPQIVRLEPNGSLVRIAGLDPNALPPLDGSETALNNPRGLVLDNNSNLLVADTDQRRILRRTKTGQVEVVATGLEQPGPLSVGADGSVYAALIQPQTVKRINPAGQVENFAGSEDFRFGADGGLATNATFRSISSLAWLPRGLAISDTGVHRIRLVEPSGIIRALAGNGVAGFSRGNEPAIDSPLTLPGAMAIDKRGELHFYDRQYFRFLRITSAGLLLILPSSIPGDGLSADRCRLDGFMSSFAFDSKNALVFGTRSSICRMEPDGTTWLVDGGYGVIGALTMDAEDRIYVTDALNNRVVLVEPANVGVPFEQIPKISAVVGAGGSRSPGITQISPGALLTVYGTGFTRIGLRRSVAPEDIEDGSLPKSLGGVCIVLGGVRAPLTFVSESQINFQAPYTLTNVSEVRVVANCGGPQEFTSVGLRVEFALATPEFLYWTNNGSTRSPIVAVEASTNAFIGGVNLIPGLNFRPARPGDVLTLYCISLGLTNPSLEAGMPSQGPAPVRGTVQVLINNAPMTPSDVLYAGASPGTAGLYQINLRVPNLPDGEHPIQIRIDSSLSPSDGYLLVRR